jgi:predicted DNA-binding transcriptional regulator AlpA
MSNTSQLTDTGRKIIRGWRGLSARNGKSSTQNRRDVRAGKLPTPVELGPNSIGWYEDEIDAHLANLPRRTYHPGEAA